MCLGENNRLASPTFLIISILLITIVTLTIMISKETTIFAKKISTYQTWIRDKKQQSTVIYSGVFIPMVLYYFVTEEGINVNVTHRTFNRLAVGDSIWVSKYSNGKHKLEPKLS